MITDVYERLGVGGHEHPAAGLFDVNEFIEAVCAVRKPLRESDSEMTWVEIVNTEGEAAGVSLHGWTGSDSAIVHVAGPYPWMEATREALIPLVTERDLMLYDADRQIVFNNRRSYD